MAKLQPIKPLIDELARKSSEIDALEDQLEVPRATKEKFGDAWGKEFIVKADYIKLKTAKRKTDRGVRSRIDKVRQCRRAVQRI